MDHIPTTLAPWLSVRKGTEAVAFYQTALGAVEVYHLDGPDGTVVSRLSVEGAGFWLSDDPAGDPLQLNGSPVRMILTVADPDRVFDRALKAGAVAVFPVGEGHGWRLGRLVDPFGHHWEIGRPL